MNDPQARTAQIAVALLFTLLLAAAFHQSAHAQTSQVGACAANRPGAPNNFNCTSSDVQIADVRVVNGVTSCIQGENVTVVLAVDVALNATTRYDIGYYLALDGTSPVNGGSCLLHQFSTASPFTNLDGDACGDINADIFNHTVIQPVTLKCAAGADGSLKLPVMSFWDNRADPACSNVPGTAAKCNLVDLSVDVQVVGAITVTKIASPRSPAEFDYTYSGAASGAFSLVDDAPQPGANTHVITVPISGPSVSVTIAETLPGSDWRLEHSSCGWQYARQPAGSATVTLTPQRPTATCTFYNERNARIIVEKRTLPSGAPGDFPVTITGGPGSVTFQGTLSDGESLDTGFTLLPGTVQYVIQESVPAGWQQEYQISCSSPYRRSTGLGFSYALSPGETLTCVITNRQLGSISVTKTAVGAGGVFAYLLSGSMPQTVSVPAGGTQSVEWANLPAGAYVLSELAQEGCTPDSLRAAARPAAP